MADRVLVDVVDGIADVRLNRPDKHNALDAAMFEGLAEAANRVAADPSVRVVVLSGEGASFCSGLDFASFFTPGERPVVDLFERRGIANLAQQVAYTWVEVPVPVIASVHGHCYGGGLQIAAGADIRVVAPDARLSVMEIKWGLVPDMTGTQLLPRIIGLDRAKELTFTGRIVSGTDAVSMGLATMESEGAQGGPRETAMSLAGVIAGKNPDALAGAKRLLDSAGRVSLAEGFQMEERIQRRIIGSPNQREALAANMERRAPVFGDRSVDLDT